MDSSFYKYFPQRFERKTHSSLEQYNDQWQPVEERSVEFYDHHKMRLKKAVLESS
jgi:hypothetical protein